MAYLVGLGVVLLGAVYFLNKKMNKAEHAQDENRKKTLLMKIAMVVSILLIVIPSVVLLTNGSKQEEKHQEVAKAKLVTVDKKDARLKNGKAAVKITVAQDTKITIKHKKGQVDPIRETAKNKKRQLTIVFVVPGEYEITAEQNKTKQTELLKIKSDSSRPSSETSSKSSTSEALEESQTSIYAENEVDPMQGEQQSVIVPDNSNNGIVPPVQPVQPVQPPVQEEQQNVPEESTDKPTETQTEQGESRVETPDVDEIAVDTLKEKNVEQTSSEVIA